MTLPCVRREDLLSAAESYQVCPFELSLDFSLYCDIVICDYNYVFDPRVRLVRYFEESLNVRRLLLVDEAHNLPDRSREMFSAELTESSFSAMSEALMGMEDSLDKAILGLKRYFDTLSAGLATQDPAIDRLEEGISPAGVLVADRFRALRQTPVRLQSLLWRFLRRCDAGRLDALPAGKAKRAAKTFFFDTLFFLRVADEFYDPTYVTTYTMQNGQTMVRLMCLDASAKLASVYRGRFASVFFSATLSPMRYFERMLSGRDAQGSILSMTLPSPFPPENLLVCLAGTIGTRYRQRQETAWQVASAIDAATSQKTGNYLVFLSSFTYLRQVQSSYLELARSKSDSIPVVIAQTPGMSEANRQRFLDHFSRFGKTTLVAFAVLGGVFGEGIDLVGDRLSGWSSSEQGYPCFARTGNHA
jgi:DNA excision repair protein ERCC-2